jgi:hypothetical protein
MPQHIKEKEKINGVSSAATAMGGGTEQEGMAVTALLMPLIFSFSLMC